MKIKFTTIFGVSAICMLGFAQMGVAQVIFFQNFDDATPGQSLAEAPLNWSHAYGLSFGVAADIHPGWNGNAVYGRSMATGANGEYRHSIDLPSTGLVKVTFKCWAYGQYYGGFVGVRDGGFEDTGIEFGYWKNIHGAGFYCSTTSAPISWFGNSFAGSTAFAECYLDLTNRAAWMVISDGQSSRARSQTFPISTSFLGTHLQIWDDRREGYSGFDIDDLKVTLYNRVSGNALLDGYTASTAGDVLEVQVWQNDTLVETLDGNYGPNGTFAFSPTVNGDAVLKFRFRTGLWKAVSVTLDETPIESLTVNMTNGDCDGDNEVTLVDFGILASVFGKSVSDPGYDTRGDLDGDTEITLVDYGVLAANFGAIGD